MVSAVMGWHEIEALTNLAGYRTVIVKADAPEPKQPKNFRDKVISRLTDDEIDVLVEDPEYGEHLRFYVYLLSGQFDDIKKSCFYVDRNENTESIETGFEIDRNICDGALRAARKAIYATKVNLRRYWGFVLSKRELRRD